jgi:peptidoglycan hydrolase-like protein with peptidoglycan-binding domain
MPESYLRFGADGLVAVTGDGVEELLAEAPIGSATSDGAGGVLYTEWTPEWRFGPTFGPTLWLPDGQDDAQVGSLGLPARLDGRAVVVGSFPTDECGEDSVDRMVARDLRTGVDMVLQCAVAGPDDGWGPDSYGGGMYVGDHWNAVLDRGALYSSLALVFRDERGEMIDHSANPYDGDCQPCELTAALSPDGARLAVIYRPDALQFRNDNWAVETTAIDAQLQVFDLTDGDLLFEQVVPAGAQPHWPWHPWFDGRYVVLGPDRFDHPYLEHGDRQPAVSTLQRLLVDHGADVDVDGIFGPDTEAAVEAFHLERFGASRSEVHTETWTGLGVPDTIIDTHTGESTQVPGSIALDLTFTDDAEISPESTTDPQTLAILRPDGLGPVDLGTPAEQAISALTDLLGAPDDVVLVGPIGPGEDGCVEGASWEDCIRAHGVLVEGQILHWTTHGLAAALTDAERKGAELQPTPVRLTSWRAVLPTDGEAATTAEGIGPGATVGDIRAVDSDVDWTFNEGVWDGVVLVSGRDGDGRPSSGIWAQFDWDHDNNGYVKAMQRALNAQGANLVVDGVIGPATRDAWEQFCRAHDLSCTAESPNLPWFITEDQRAALDFPPPDVTIATMTS